MTHRLALPLLLAALAVPALRAQPTAARSLAQRLGFAPTAIVLIVNGDDVGVSHAANQASIASLERGLMTSVYIHAALPGEEMQAVTNSWKDRAAEFELFTTDASIRALLEQKAVQRIGYRALRDLQRAHAR